LANTRYIEIPAVLLKKDRRLIPIIDFHPLIFIVFFSLLTVNLALSEYYTATIASLITTITFTFLSTPLFHSRRPITKPIPKTRQEAGLIGEMCIASGISSILNNDHIILHNVYVPNSRSRTGTTEIDLIILSPKNITIIEVKNVVGVIDARSKDLPWPVFKFKGDKFIQAEMRNPIRQTRIQKQVLQAWLRDKGLDIEISAALAFPNAKTKILNYHNIEFPIARDKIDLASIVTTPCRKRRINTNQLASKLMSESSKLKIHTQKVIQTLDQQQ